MKWVELWLVGWPVPSAHWPVDGGRRNTCLGRGEAPDWVLDLQEAMYTCPHLHAAFHVSAFWCLRNNCSFEWSVTENTFCLKSGHCPALFWSLLSWHVFLRPVIVACVFVFEVRFLQTRSWVFIPDGVLLMWSLDPGVESDDH